jgi:hypothetical protein
MELSFAYLRPSGMLLTHPADIVAKRAFDQMKTVRAFYRLQVE